MRVGRRIWLILMLLLLSLGWASPVTSAPPEAVPTTDRGLLFGIAGHGWWLEQHLDTFVAAQRELGVTSVRLSIDWKYIEATPGVYQWERYDRVLGRLVEEQFTIVGVFVTVPAWAASDPAACGVEENELKACDLPASQAEAFEQVVRATLTRYPFIRYWEFWNEPELWTHLGHDVGDYLPWLARFYRIAKETDPGLAVAAGTLAGWEYLGWMYDVSENMLGPGVRPWDAVAFHPYNTHRARDANGEVLAIREAEIERIRAEMIARGDGHKPLWLTEYGWDEEPAVQAHRLRRAMDWMLARDYITMAHVHMLHDWEKETYGLMRTEPNVVGVGPIGSTTRFVPKEPYFSAFRDFPRPLLPHVEAHAGVAPTGQVVAPVFQEAWQAGGIPRHGYPLTRPFWERHGERDYVLVQYCERTRFEWRQDTGVRMGLLGDEALRRHGWLDDWGRPLVAATQPEPPPVDGEALYFAETGQALRGAFRAAWEAGGGLASMGYPRTGVLTEVTSDATVLLVQYTQRGRLEHAQTPDGSSVMYFGLLGTEALQERQWLDAAGQPRPDYLNPARRAYRE